MSVTRKELTNYLNKYLNIDSYEDYGPNGLQVEGIEEINKIAFAVSATKDSINQASEKKAQALIVHHGLFWKFHGPKTITGAFARRIKPLIKNDINLYAYHLPLDGHQEIGNAKAIADLLELTNIQSFGDYKKMPTGVWGKFQPQTAAKLKEKLEKILNHNVLHSCPNDLKISSIGIITGGANSNWTEAKSLGLDSYLTGEMSEHDWNEAKEDNIHMFAGGHHATERFGIQKLQKHLEEKFKNKIETFYIDSDNPA